MKMKFLSATLLVSLLFLSSNCKKDKTGTTTDPNPPNSFSCYINGVYWEAYADFTWGGPVAVQAEFNETSGTLSLTATKRKPDLNIYETIYLACDSILEEKQYFLTPGNGELVGYQGYYHDPQNPGILNITSFDKEKRIIEGTFSVTLKNKNFSPDSLRLLTNGKLRFSY
jgi:hypothetical protein